MLPVFATAFLEGISVLIVEIAGARALAPFFGTSMFVWTATITATLLFLATGYGLGGRLYGRDPLMLARVFWVAGGWLLFYPFWRGVVLSACAALGVSLGAFVASAFLFGPPLTCLGAVSPLLVHRLAQRGVEGGHAVGTLFLVNTLGGLLGGWLTALVLVPYLPLRLALAGTGAALVVLGALWARSLGARASLVLTGVACAVLMSMAPRPRNVVMSAGETVKVIHRQETASGLVQVFEVPGKSRSLHINGVNQGGIDLASGASNYPFSDYLAAMVHAYHPAPRRALLLGLGCGVLAKTLHGMGVEVTAVEIEPEVVKAARSYFGLPQGVKVIVDDARAHLRRDRSQYDVVVLDAFAGESSPWYLLTREALSEVHARLSPGGRMVVNAVTRADGESEGLKRLEAGLLAVFGEALVFVEPRLPNEGDQLVNATLVAGTKLVRNQAPYRGLTSRAMQAYVGDFNGTELRPARKGAVLDSDDYSSLDLAEADTRMAWREDVLEKLGPDVLGD